MGNCNSICKVQKALEDEELTEEEFNQMKLSNTFDYSQERTLIQTKNNELVKYLQNGIEHIPLKNGINYKGSVSQNGLAEGQGILSVPNKYEFNGEWVDGKPNGFGIIKYSNQNNYEGNLKDGVPHGNGVFNFLEGYYQGEFNNGLYEGKGEMTWYDGRKYIGEFKKGEYDGQGEFHWGNGKIFKGQYQKGRKQGPGKLFQNDKEIFDGYWDNGKVVQGKMMVESVKNGFNNQIKIFNKFTYKKYTFMIQNQIGIIVSSQSSKQCQTFSNIIDSLVS